MSGQRLSCGRSRKAQPGMRHRPRQDQHVQVQRPQRGRRPQEDHDGEDEESEFIESVTDVPVAVRSEVCLCIGLRVTFMFTVQEPHRQTQRRVEDVCK